jgi:hypothetical protein
MINKVKDYLGGFIPGENSYKQGNKEWYLSTLEDACEGLQILNYDLFSLDLDSYPWNFKNWSFDHFLYHVKRMENVDMDKPIILTPYGYICDGWHRVARAIMEGRQSVQCYRLKVMPEPDKVNENGSN